MTERSGELPLVVRRIGVVESPLTDLNTAPLQGDEGAPAAWLSLDPSVADALRGPP